MRGVIGAVVGLVLGIGFVEPAAAAKCPGDSVASGTACMDTYEASVWHVPPSETSLITKIQNGGVTLANLTSAGAMAAGVMQLGLVDGDLGAAGCPVTGNGCVDIYAVSIPGVTPAAFITWFQAAAAARNSLKRLPTNQEWQVAALGTPDAAPCNVGSGGVAITGNAAECVSDVGALDLVGNLTEWVGDWGDLAGGCSSWSATFGSDISCVGGPILGFGFLPGALLRGGGWSDPASFAGVFNVNAGVNPSIASQFIGFRCAR
jgi:Sulfatase-modifying factor enzyme 1